MKSLWSFVWWLCWGPGVAPQTTWTPISAKGGWFIECTPQGWLTKATTQAGELETALDISQGQFIKAKNAKTTMSSESGAESVTWWSALTQALWQTVHIVFYFNESDVRLMVVEFLKINKAHTEGHVVSRTVLRVTSLCQWLAGMLQQQYGIVGGMGQNGCGYAGEQASTDGFFFSYKFSFFWSLRVCSV